MREFVMGENAFQGNHVGIKAGSFQYSKFPLPLLFGLFSCHFNKAHKGKLSK